MNAATDSVHYGGVYLSVKICEVFLCFEAIVRIRVYYVDFSVFFVYVTGECHRFYNEDEPYCAYDKNEQVF